MTFDPALLADAREILDLCRRADVRLATAESCTGGLIAACLTALPGSSDVLERGFITYSNAAKTEMLGVSSMLINFEGAVSEKVARAMAEGAVARSAADIAVAVTGIAGPAGETDQKPIGLVHMACAGTGRPTHHNAQIYPGGRDAVRDAAVIGAFAMIRGLLRSGA